MEENKSIELSVIIPAYNRRESLRECLVSFEKQDYPADRFEIIVIDDGSQDGTAEMVRGLMRENNNLLYFQQSHKGPAAARNFGVEKSKGSVVSFTDTDCVPESNWVKKIIEAHCKNQGAVVIGGLTEVQRGNIKASVSQSLSNGAMSVSINREREFIFFPTCNVSFKKDKIEEKFDELFPFPAGEDLEFFWRIFKRKKKLIFDPDIKIMHNCHSNLKSFIKQAYLYGRGNYHVKYFHNDHPLLEELKCGNIFTFLLGTLINFIKIPRFSYLLGKRLIVSAPVYTRADKLQVYVYFGLHKAAYLIGNIVEYKRMVSVTKMAEQKNQKRHESREKPDFIILDITHRCNLNCNICEIRKDPPAPEFTSEEVKRLIFQAKEWGVSDFVLSGGEPFVRDDIFEILDFAKNNNYRIGILTNGILLEQKFISRLLPYFLSNALSLSISLDALSPEIHDGIRGLKGSFNKTFNGLKALSELKSSYRSVNFNTITIVLNENLEELLLLADLLKSLDVDSIQFQPLLENNLIMKERSGGAKYWVPSERLPLLDKVVDDLVAFKIRNPGLVRNSGKNLVLIKKYFRGFLASEEIKCRYADKTMLVSSCADVTTCFDCYGNAREGSLKEIYYSKKAEAARKKVLNCRKPCLLPCFTDY